MSVDGTKSRRTKADIDALVAKWRESGQSVPKFSAENAVGSSSLYQWISERKQGAAKGKHRRETKDTLVPSFTKVDVVARESPKRGGPLTIVTADGHAITVGRDGVDAEVLRTVLSVVGEC